MIDRYRNSKVHLWKEVLPLILFVAVLFYFSLIWNPVLIGLIFIPILVFAYIFYPEKLWWLVIGMVPFSVDLDLYIDTPVGMYFPTEPILVGFLLLSLMYLWRHPPDCKFLRHPVVWLIIAYFSWMAISVVTSSDVIVSLKSFTVQLWFVVPVLFLGSRILSEKDHREKFFRIYIFSFSLVVIYTLIRLAWYGFPIKEAEWLMRPFLKDHTLMGAVLGLTMPYIALKAFQKNIRIGKRILWLTLLVIYAVVLIETHSRAALLSLILAGGLYICIALRIRFQYLIGLLFVVGMIVWSSQDIIFNYLESNESESRGDYVEHLESISNVSTDASNLERINRWNSAVAMWQERPFVGWGPGTYQFEYAPFQKSEDLTIISTNIGDVGNAHSEYLGVLAESGAPAALFFTLFVVVVIGIGYNTVLDLKGTDRLISMAALLGFSAYFFHGILNNFLDSDKASVLVWGFTAIILHYHMEVKSLSSTKGGNS